MFTGIIASLGIIDFIGRNDKKDLLVKISVNKSKLKREFQAGCSIACNGICLTLITKQHVAQKIIFSFQASDESCQKTTLASWMVGQMVNLEFALRAGDELGGHMVLGHVDAVAEIKEIRPVKDSHKITFLAPAHLVKFIVKKGSVAIDGVSLTINEVEKNSFSVNVIEYTFQNTIFKNVSINDLVNLEIDLIARYVLNGVERLEPVFKIS
jgi:riboflavin synthase